MQDYRGDIPAGGGRMERAGCAISLAADIAFDAGSTTTTPDTIRMNENNFNGDGLRWNEALVDVNVTTGNRIEGQLSIGRFNELDADATEYYIGLKVNYSGDAGDDHWVGVSGVYSDGGADYFVISGTSENDSVMGNNPRGNNRGGMGWRNIRGVGTVVPVNAILAYRIFTVNRADE